MEFHALLWKFWKKKFPKKSGKVEFSKTFYLKIFHVSVDYACKVSSYHRSRCADNHTDTEIVLVIWYPIFAEILRWNPSFVSQIMCVFVVNIKCAPLLFRTTDSPIRNAFANQTWQAIISYIAWIVQMPVYLKKMCSKRQKLRLTSISF